MQGIEDAITNRADVISLSVGAVADPLVPAQYETAGAAPHERAAVWLDLVVPEHALPGLYRGELVVRPRRPEAALGRHPASTLRVHNPAGCAASPQTR